MRDMCMSLEGVRRVATCPHLGHDRRSLSHGGDSSCSQERRDKTKRCPDRSKRTYCTGLQPLPCCFTRGRRRLRSKYRFVRAATRVRRAAIRRRSEPLTATAGLGMISELYEMLQASLELGLV